MELVKTAALTQTQKQDLILLEAACQNEGTGSVGFPMDDADLFFLLYDPQQEPQLVSALFLIMPQFPNSDEAAECIAFTRPEVRRKGYFSLLFEKAEEEIKDIDLLFPTDGQDEGALHALKSLGAEFSHDEYRMELALTECFFPSAGEKKNRLSCRIEETGGSVRSYTFYPAYPDSGSPLPASDSSTFLIPGAQKPSAIPAAACRAACFGRTACFYGFSVNPELRNRGLGRQALRLVLLDLRNQGIQSLSLHVSGSNLPAVSLYKKTGFRITETLSYYLY